MSPELLQSLVMLRDITDRARAMGLGLVAYPVDDVERIIGVVSAGARVRPAVAPKPNADALDRAIGLLKQVIDQPLATLPGAIEPGCKGTTRLSLHHFRPELSESIAALLEELGS